jgi:phage baseplate assembly protein W
MSVAHASRQKISTTISPESLAYLEQLIDRKQARTLADAIDLAVERLLIYENRERLAEDTAAYFDRMTPEQTEEEERLGAALAASVKGIDFNREP